MAHIWCPWSESNRHACRRQILRLLCLPFHHKGFKLAEGIGFEPMGRFYTSTSLAVRHLKPDSVNLPIKIQQMYWIRTSISFTHLFSSRGKSVLRLELTLATGGRGEIRTHGTLLTFNGFQDRRHQPLGHSSITYKHFVMVFLVAVDKNYSDGHHIFLLTTYHKLHKTLHRNIHYVLQHLREIHAS
jgi:hypothetical protein